ncbi:GRAM domain-containing protein 2B-like isoform X2 [Episyrphus balteatus]|uniref:GRAM domain-containing protein 2B-like isoform X2 n=1 Tax=Episyrphus balteatus TaxID=286459 RepID=UPI002485AAB4|nr:GRAM domain-containing protein 2B-like isoform X2 [Episyrphus balteatus]
MSQTKHDNSPRSSVKSAPNQIPSSGGGSLSMEETLPKCKSELDLVKNRSNLFLIKSYSFIDKSSRYRNSNKNHHHNNDNSDVLNLIELSKMKSKSGTTSAANVDSSTNYDDLLLLRRKSGNGERLVRPKSLPSSGNSIKRESFLRQSFQSIRRSFTKKSSSSSAGGGGGALASVVLSSSSSGGSERTNCESDFEVVEVNGGSVRTRSILGDLKEEEDESRTSKGSSIRAKKAVNRSTSSVSTLSHSAPGSPMAPLQGHSETQSVNCLNDIGKNSSSPLSLTQSNSTIPFTIASKGDNKALRQTNSTTLPLVSSSANLRSLSPHSKVTIVSKNDVAQKEEKKRKEVSSSRLKKFHRHFTQVSKDERVINYFSCALVSDILLQGHLYITDHHFAFYSNVFGYVTKVVIPTSSVTKISKEKVAKIIPNAVGVATADERHVFGSFLSRESAFRLMCSVCPTETPAPLIQKALPDVEISEECSIEDDSSCSISGNESPPQALIAGRPLTASESSHTLLRRTGTGGKGTRSDSPNAKNSSTGTLGKTRTAPPIPSTNTTTTNTSKFNVVYMGVVLSLILAIFSGFLLYRILDIEAKTSLYRSTVEFNWGSGNDADVFAEALRWQKELQSKSTEEAQNILHSNLQQIAKVRRSLETLSMLIHDRSSSASSTSKSEGDVDRDDTD